MNKDKVFQISVPGQGCLRLQLEPFDDGSCQLHFERNDQTIWSREYKTIERGEYAFDGASAALGELR